MCAVRLSRAYQYVEVATICSYALLVPTAPKNRMQRPAVFIVTELTMTMANHQNDHERSLTLTTTCLLAKTNNTSKLLAYVLGSFVCKTVSYLQGVAVSASINTMVTVTMDR